jgi:hypothetical protein
MLGVDFDGFGYNFGLHVDSNFGSEMRRFFKNNLLIDCWIWF